MSLKAPDPMDGLKLKTTSTGQSWICSKDISRDMVLCGMDAKDLRRVWPDKNNLESHYHFKVITHHDYMILLSGELIVSKKLIHFNICEISNWRLIWIIKVQK